MDVAGRACTLTQSIVAFGNTTAARCRSHYNLDRAAAGCDRERKRFGIAEHYKCPKGIGNGSVFLSSFGSFSSFIASETRKEENEHKRLEF